MVAMTTYNGPTEKLLILDVRGYLSAGETGREP